MKMSTDSNIGLEKKKMLEQKTEIKFIGIRDHPFIQMIDEFEIEGYQCLVIDITNQCSLQKLIDERKTANQPFSEYEIMRMCSCIAFGLLQINSMGGSLRHMTPNDIFVQRIDDLDYLVLTDNGSSKYSGDAILNISPELLSDNPNCYKEDVLALGAILYKLSSFKLPFDSQLKSQQAIKNLDQINTKIENRSPELNGLIDAMLQRKQEDRPSIKQLFLEFPILQNAILDLLQKFVLVKNSTFEKLVKQLITDNDLKNAYSIIIDPLLTLRQASLQTNFQELQTRERPLKGQYLFSEPHKQESLICEDSKDLQKSEDPWIEGQFLFEDTLIQKNGDIFDGFFFDRKNKRGTQTVTVVGKLQDISENMFELLQRMLQSSKDINSDFIVIKFEGD